MVVVGVVGLALLPAVFKVITSRGPETRPAVDIAGEASREQGRLPVWPAVVGLAAATAEIVLGNPASALTFASIAVIYLAIVGAMRGRGRR
jgi:hypothetical protein